MAVLAAKIKALVTKAFQKTGDLRTSATFNQITVGAYDPATGAPSVATTTTTLTNTILTSISSSEAGWFPADRNTQKLFIAASDLPTRPTLTDNVIIDGVTWEIVKVRTVPGYSLWIVFIMEP